MRSAHTSPLCLAASALLLTALATGCADPATTTPAHNNTAPDPMDMGMAWDMEPVGDKLANGAGCVESARCVSGACIGGACAATSPGVVACGAVHCASGQACKQNVCVAPSQCDTGGEACGGACCLANEECLDGVCAPTCQSGGARCETDEGSICCGVDQACLFGGCIEQGNACNDTMPCPSNLQYCEPTLNRCIDRDADPNACIYQPPAEMFSPVDAWTWTMGQNATEYDQVMMMPVVGNLNDDDLDGKIDSGDIPDVLFVTFTGNQYNGPGVLRAISGDGKKEHWDSASLPTPFFVRGGTIPAIGDIDGDGIMEIIVGASDADTGVYALEHDGTIKWHREAIGSMGHGSPAIANLDGAGGVEIVTSNAVLSADGEVICALGSSYILPMVADLDQDGAQEILHGGTVWQLDDASARDGSGCSQRFAGPVGAGAVANLDEDEAPEIVVIQNGDIIILEDDGQEKWRETMPIDQARIEALYGITDCSAAPAGQSCSAHTDCGGGAERCYGGSCYLHKACNPGGGPPTVADFDGDGEADIAVAARWYYLVMKASGEVIWAHSTRDFSSGVTGSAVFDFEGDGKAEVVYNDEEFLRIYRGSGAGEDADQDGFPDPVILLEVPNTSGTLYEYPLIVDVDNDGNAEIVVAANDYSSSANPEKTKGIRVLRDTQNNWVRTRPIWNQHTYHVTNIDEDGQIPLTEEANWRQPHLNNYRQNVQGGSLFNAPDLAIEVVSIDGSNCSDEITITVELINQGSIGVRADAVTFVVESEVGGQTVQIAELTNTVALAPDGRERLEVTWKLTTEQYAQVAGKELNATAHIDRDASGASRHNECDESNNSGQNFAICELPM